MKTNLNFFSQDHPPVKPEKDIPVKPDQNPDPTRPMPGGNEPEKIDPTRIEQPGKNDPTRIDDPPPTIPQPPQEHNLYSIKSLHHVIN